MTVTTAALHPECVSSLDRKRSGRETESERQRAKKNCEWVAHHGGVELRHAAARTACDARNSVANGACCVPACVSFPSTATKNPSAAGGGAGSGAGCGVGGRGGAPLQLLRRSPSCL